MKPAPIDFALEDSSFCRDRGEPSPAFVPGAGEQDFFGASRVANGRVDIGFHEFMTAWQGWRDVYFGLPDGGSGAEATDDPDRDTAGNLIEFSQGMDPTVPDTDRLPGVSRTGSAAMRFHYRKDQPDLSYVVEASPLLPGPDDWSDLALPEQTDGAGNYWREIPLTEARLFVRLKVALPAP